jgi:Ca-activated chloride channel family protein
VGLDYDEGTLGAMAVRSAGRLYHLEEPSQMASILDQELQLLGRTVAANAYIEFAPADGVAIEATEATRLDHRGATVRIPLGSLYAAQHREVLLRARIPTAGEGTRSLGTARLVWNDPTAANEERQSGDLTLGYELTGDDAAARASVTERVQAMVLSREVAQAQVRASQLLNQGDAERATRELEAAETRLQQAQVSFSDDSVRGSLQRQAEGVARGRSAAASAASAPAPSRPARARAAALQNNSSAMDAYGY